MKFGINYSISKNHLSKKEQFIARHHSVDTFDTKDLVKEIVNLGSTLTEVDIEATLTFLKKAIKKILLLGGKIKIDDLCLFYSSISGTFDSEDDSFDRSQHSYKVKCRVDNGFTKKILNDAELNKITLPDNKPSITKITDFTTHSIPSRIRCLMSTCIFIKPVHDIIEPVFFIS